MNYAYLSLEQEFTLRVLSDQIHQSTDISKLQNDLIDLFEKVLIKHQNLKDIYSFSREQNEKIALYSRNSETLVSSLEDEATMFSVYVDSIKDNFDMEELQALLIEASEISMMQSNYSNFVSQNYA